MRSASLLATLMLASFAMAADPANVYVELRNIGCEGDSRQILEIEGRYPDSTEVSDFLACRWTSLFFEAPFSPMEERWLTGILDAAGVEYSACDDAETCGKRIKEECGKEGNKVTAQRIVFDSTSKTPCTGACSNGSAVSITCVKAKKPVPPTVTEAPHE